jgi:acetylornithine/succinyldiaminopimelate/putrescine aminotransferase
MPHKDTILSLYSKHINSKRVTGWRRVGLDIVEHRREGCYIWDADGKRYIDCYNGAGVFNVGRANPVIRKVLVEATANEDIGDFLLISEAKALLAAQLAEITPGDLSCVMYGVGGGEANDYAVKLARGFTGKSIIITMERAYHGHTGFSLAGIGRERYQTPFMPMVPGFMRVPLNDLGALERAMTKEVAAVMLEPIQGEGGIHCATADFLRGARELCDRNSALLVFDEVQTGFGRTGRMFFAEHYGVTPDILTMGKSMSGGYYPISATVFGPRLNEFNLGHPYIHLSTFGGSDIGCRVAMATIDYIRKERLCERAESMGNHLIGRLRAVARNHPGVLREVRGMGLMIGLQFANDAHGPMMSQLLARRGVIAIYSGNETSVMRLMLALVASDEVVNCVAEAIADATDELAANTETVAKRT